MNHILGSILVLLGIMLTIIELNKLKIVESISEGNGLRIWILSLFGVVSGMFLSI